MDWYIVVFTLAFIILDCLTGTAQAIYNKVLDSSIMREGMFHKAALVGIMIVAILCEYAVQHIDFGNGTMSLNGWLIMAVCAWVCIAELISILENLAKINSDLASSKLLEFFAVITSSNGDHTKAKEESNNAKRD